MCVVANLDDSLVRRDSRGRKLGVDVRRNLDFATNNWEGYVVRLGRPRVALVGLGMVASVEGVPVVELSVSAGEDGAAGSDHLGGESELLAVENESVLLVMKVVFGVHALVEQAQDSVMDTTEVFLERLHV